MTFKWLRNIFKEPTFWLMMSQVFTVAAFLLWWHGHVCYAVIVFLASLILVRKVVIRINRWRSRVEYLVEATLNGDFTCKFPVDGVSETEKEMNEALNRVVGHLEKLDQAVRQDEEFLAYIINLVDMGIIVADSKGHIIHSNKAALKLLSLPVLTDICQLPEKTELSVKVTKTHLHGKELNIYTVSDIRRFIQVAEVESWEKLTRVLTHEIMNMLTPINSISQGLSQTRVVDEKNMRYQMQVISQSTRSLMNFVKNFRKFTILPEPKFKVFYIKPFLDKIASLFVNQTIAAEVGITVECFPADMMMCSDESLLNQVIVNIVKNAVEANAKKIKISSRIASDESITISIANDGNPIADEIASQIFTPFFTTRHEGSGVGLSLSRRIISHLGGTLSLTTAPYTSFNIRI